VKYKEQYLHCGDQLLNRQRDEINEISEIISHMKWAAEFSLTQGGKNFLHQAAYNKAFEIQFHSYGWQVKPFLKDSPRLIGDFRKNLVFVEIQFGNSSTLYRDFYKFQYGHQNGLLSLSVLIVPYNEYEFFPDRDNSVQNMANFDLALRYFTVLPISVPAWIIGLLPEN
jgi:hypothetical protein